MGSIVFRIAGVCVAVHTTPDVRDELVKRCGAYLVAAGVPDLVLTVRRGDGLGLSKKPLPVDYPRVAITHEGGHYHFERRDLLLDLELGLPARAEGVVGIGTRAAESLIRLCLTTMLPQRGALILHAASLKYRGRGFVFTGVSGAGKSTTIRMLTSDREVQSLGDEVAVLHVQHPGVLVESTPFGGELEPVPPGAAPLARLFFLQREQGSLETVAGRGARLLRNTLYGGGDPELAQAVLRNAEAIVSRVECHEILRPTLAELRCVIAA